MLLYYHPNMGGRTHEMLSLNKNNTASLGKRSAWRLGNAGPRTQPRRACGLSRTPRALASKTACE